MRISLRTRSKADLASSRRTKRGREEERELCMAVVRSREASS